MLGERKAKYICRECIEVGGNIFGQLQFHHKDTKDTKKKAYFAYNSLCRKVSVYATYATSVVKFFVSTEKDTLPIRMRDETLSASCGWWLGLDLWRLSFIMCHGESKVRSVLLRAMKTEEEF